MSYKSTILADSPVSLWMLDETSGTSAADSAGSNTGTYTGTVTLNQSTGLSGVTKSISLGGNNANYVALKTGTILSGLSTYSIEAWLKTTNSTGFATLYCERAASGNDVVQLGINSSGKIQHAYRDDGATILVVNSAGSYNDGNWHHLVVVCNANAVTVYVDGAVAGTGTYTGGHTFTNAGLVTRGGADPTDGATAVTMGLAAVAVYNSALSLIQVQGHFIAGAMMAVTQQAFSFVSANSGQSGTSSTAVAKSVTAGNLIVVILGTTHTGFNPLSGVTDSQGNLYLLLANQNVGANYQGRVYITVASATGSLTVTGHSSFGGAGVTEVGVGEFAGLDSTINVVGVTTGTNGSGGKTMPTVTTSVPTVFILTGWGSDYGGGATFTPTSYTVDYNNSSNSQMFCHNKWATSGSHGGETFNQVNSAGQGSVFTVSAFPLAAPSSFPILFAA